MTTDKGKTLTAAVLAAGAGLSVPGTGAWAEQETAEVETVVVTATRLEKPLSEVARSIAVIQRDEMDTIQAPSVARTLSYQPNISVEGGPRAANQTVNVRGLGGNKILQTVDGARQSFESGHRPSYFLEPELLRSVEAVRGPASSLWGSGAVGGVIAQNTIAPSDLLDDGEELGGFVKTGYNDNNSGSATTLAMVGQTPVHGWLISGYYRDSDDLEMGNGDDLEGSEAETWGSLAKWTWDVSDTQQMEFTYRHADWDGEVPSNGTAPANGTSNFVIDRDQTTDNVTAAYRVDRDNDLLDLEALFYSNSVEMDEQRISDSRPDNTQLDTLGFNLSNVSAFGEMRMIYGMEAYEEDFDAKRGGTDRPEPPDAETTVWAAFAATEIPLAERWNLELGVRYDDFETEADNLGLDSSDNAVSPSAAVVWEPADWAVLSLRHDHAFRAPGAEELYSSGFHFCMGPGFCNSFRPNPELDPEEAANTELNAKLAFANVAGADVIHVEASIFHNEVDDFIEQIVVGPSFFPFPDPGYTTWNNVDKATLEGGELAVNYLRGGLSLKASYGQVRGEDDDTNDDLTNIPADTMVLDASYAFDSINLLAGLRFTAADDQDRTDYEENVAGTTYDSYNITDLYASWQPTALPALRFNLNVNNLEDDHYRRAWDELYQAGREVILSAYYQF